MVSVTFGAFPTKADVTDVGNTRWFFFLRFFKFFLKVQIKFASENDFRGKNEEK